jgi:hypothetical protein
VPGHQVRPGDRGRRAGGQPDQHPGSLSHRRATRAQHNGPEGRDLPARYRRAIAPAQATRR